MALNRFDTFLPNDYQFQVYQPQEYVPDLGMLDSLLGGLQKEYDTGMDALNRIMPNYLRNSESDTEAAKQYRSKFDNLITSASDAFASGNVSEGRRLMSEGLREIERDKLPGGEYHALERRKQEFESQDNILKETYLNPQSKQYDPQAYSYYRSQLESSISPFKDDSGNYGVINPPKTTKMYSDEELNQMYIKGISSLPADQFAVGPEFSSQLSGLTLGEVMSQGLTKMVDAEKVAAALQGMTGRDIIASEEEKQRIAGEEVTSWKTDSGFNPNNPLGQRLLNLTKAYSYTQRTMDHRFLPSNFGGEGKKGRTASGDEVVSTSTPDAIIIQNPVTTEVKSDNQLAEDGTVLEPTQGLEIYKNTERLYNQKAKSFGETLRTTLSSNQLNPEILDSVFFKYATDTQEEFGGIADADFIPLASEVFNDEAKYSELVNSIQSSNPSFTADQAKMQADQLITQADYLYMGMNEDIAYYNTAREKYREQFIQNNLNESERELVNFDFQKGDFTKTEFFKEQIEPALDSYVLFEKLNIQPLVAKIRVGLSAGVINEDQFNGLLTELKQVRDLSEGNVPVRDEDYEKAKNDPLVQGAREKGSPPELVSMLINKKALEFARSRKGEDLEKKLSSNKTLTTALSYYAKREADKINQEINKYSNEDIHSKVSSEIVPDMKRNMPVLNYLSAGFDHDSEVNYEKLHAIQKLQVDGRGVTAKTTATGELQEASALVESANMYRVTPEQMFEKDGFVFETVKDNNKLGLKDKAEVAGVKVLGFVKAPDDQIYYYGQLQMSESKKKEPGEKITGGDYVYFNYSEADDLTGKYYEALGVNSNVYEDLRFFNKQLDMDRIRNTDGNKAIDTYTDTKYLGDEPVTISRNKKQDGSYGYKLKIGNKPMFNNTVVDDATLALALSRVKQAKFGSSRVDRHNNPLAFTTAVAKQAGLQLGIDYEVGDPFVGSDGKEYTTARLLGDPVSSTIKVIDKLGFYTGDGKRRWSHTAITKEQWDALPYDTAITKEQWDALPYDRKVQMIRERKVQMIREMERKERGSLLNNMSNG